MLQKGGLYNVTKLHDGATATGNGKILYCLTPDGGAVVAIGVQITGMTNGQVTFEGTIDGATWVDIESKNLSTSAEDTSTSSNGLYRILVYPMVAFRARISDYNSGTITVTAVAVT